MKIVFDLGGVVFDWDPAGLLAQTLPQRAPTPADARRWARDFFRGEGGDWSDFDRGTLDVSELIERLAYRTGLAREEVAAVVDAVPAALRPRADTIALMHCLKADGRRLFYLSNMPAPYADFLERNHSFWDCFDDGIFSSRVQLAKPEPAIFELALRRFGAAPPGDYVLLDDHAPNVDAARALGWQALLFSDAAAAAVSLRAIGS